MNQRATVLFHQYDDLKSPTDSSRRRLTKLNSLLFLLFSFEQHWLQKQKEKKECNFRLSYHF